MCKALEEPDEHPHGSERGGHSATSSSRSAPKSLGVPRSNKRSRRLLSDTELSRSAEDLRASRSKL